LPHPAWNRIVPALAVAVLAAGSMGENASGALRLVPVAGGFTSPVYAIGAPGNRNALFVVSQAGIITRVAGGSRSRFLDIRDRVAFGGERGLFSIAFHPRYGQNRRFFVYYTNNVGDLRIVEFRANASGTRALESTAKSWVAIRHRSFSNHNGGQLAFGRNGILYIGTGDGGGGGDPNNNAQRRSSRLGKLLYLNVNRPRARARIAALGLRNPWRFSVDRKTGDIWIGDVGQENWEEIDRFRPGRAGLENYGWSRWEGRHLYRSDRRLGAGRLIQPRHEYANGREGRCSVTGGFMVRGSVPGAGRYFFGDYCSGEVWSFRFVNGRKRGFRREPFRVPDALSSFGRGPRGGLLAVSHGGTVYRVANR
jgi:glucose/arabinose dehydrogenase